jgi:hypothetical protein
MNSIERFPFFRSWLASLDIGDFDGAIAFSYSNVIPTTKGPAAFRVEMKSMLLMV